LKDTILGDKNLMLSMHKTHRKQQCCQNCHYLLEPEDNFCPRCGQENTTRVVSFRMLVYEVVEDIFAWDSRWFQTVVPFLFLPGRLTNEFLAGRRMRYMPPLRLYFFVSLICFSVIAYYTTREDKGEKRREEAQKKMQADSIKNNILSALPRNMPPAQRRKIDRALSRMTVAESRNGLINRSRDTRRPDTAGSASDDFADGFVEGLVEGSDAYKNKQAEASKALGKASTDAQTEAEAQRQVREALASQKKPPKVRRDTLGGAEGEPAADKKMEGKSAEWGRAFLMLDNPLLTDKQILDSLRWEDNRWNRMKLGRVARFRNGTKEEFFAEMWDKAPLFMFVLLPLMALVMKLLYVRRRRLYIEHLIFMLHIHAFVFFLIALDIVFSNEFSESASAILVPLMLLYVWFAFYMVYKQGWFRTSLKLFSFLSLYGVGFSFFAVFAVMVLAAIY